MKESTGHGPPTRQGSDRSASPPADTAQPETTPAEEWGERHATGNIHQSGGKSAGGNPAQDTPRTDSDD